MEKSPSRRPRSSFFLVGVASLAILLFRCPFIAGFGGYKWKAKKELLKERGSGVKRKVIALALQGLVPHRRFHFPLSSLFLFPYCCFKDISRNLVVNFHHRSREIASHCSGMVLPCLNDPRTI